VCDNTAIDEDFLKSLVQYDEVNTTIEFYTDKFCDVVFENFTVNHLVGSYDIYAITRDKETGCTASFDDLLKITIKVKPKPVIRLKKQR
jgi:hypothetical protein